MSTLDLSLTYFGALVLILLLISGTKNIWISLIAGFIIFCVFYFDYGVKSFEWTITSIWPHLKEAGIIYIIAFIVGTVLSKILPLNQKVPVVTK
jgi:hypothetical protein